MPVHGLNRHKKGNHGEFMIHLFHFRNKIRSFELPQGKIQIKKKFRGIRRRKYLLAPPPPPVFCPVFIS